MSEHVMIDLETLGKGSHAAIWTIGAVKFNPTHCAESIEELMDTTERFHIQAFGFRRLDPRRQNRERFFADLFFWQVFVAHRFLRQSR